MSLKSKPFYWLECDDCGVKSTEGHVFDAWRDAGQAEDDAFDSDWIRSDAGIDRCYDCYLKTDEAKESGDE